MKELEDRGTWSDKYKGVINEHYLDTWVLYTPSKIKNKWYGHPGFESEQKIYEYLRLHNEIEIYKISYTKEYLSFYRVHKSDQTNTGPVLCNYYTPNSFKTL